MNLPEELQRDYKHAMKRFEDARYLLKHHVRHMRDEDLPSRYILDLENIDLRIATGVKEIEEFFKEES